MFRLVALLLQLLFLVFVAKETTACIQRDFGRSSFVCVCNSTHCDFDGPTDPLDPAKVRVVTTSKDEYRNFVELLDRPDNGPIDTTQVNISIFIDYSHLYQNIFGFGGAFTDAASINIKSLSVETQDTLLRFYFDDEGSRYNLVRVPIAGSDFSTRPYSYDDIEGDVDLEFFDLAEEDYLYKLPVMKRAIELCQARQEELFIFGSPWAPPAWMKTNGMVNESGTLLKEMWQPYSNYLVKFFQAYESELGINLWGFTPQNEPLTGFDPNYAFNTCGWTAEDMRDWIYQNLGPTVEAAGYRRLKLMIDDHNRFTLPEYAIPSYFDNRSSAYIDGLAIHWYQDFTIDPEVLDETHDLDPSKFILQTEACEGTGALAHVMLGDWERGQHYAEDIIQNINHWATGWVDWNLALDMIGGPNWVSNFVDSPIITNADEDEFYVQPMYYALSLFSRNVLRDAHRIYQAIINDEHDDLRATALLNPDGTVVIIVVNTSARDYTLGIQDQTQRAVVQTTISANSWKAVTYVT